MFLTWSLFLTGEEPNDSDIDLPKVYETIETFESLKGRLNMFLGLYNESVRGTGMDMVFFQDAMIHLVKVILTSFLTIQNIANTHLSLSLSSFLLINKPFVAH